MRTRRLKSRQIEVDNEQFTKRGRRKSWRGYATGGCIITVADTMSWLHSIFGSKGDHPAPKMVDPDFGPITYDGEASGFWQSDQDACVEQHRANYGFSAIPGDANGPYPWSRAILLQRRQELPRLWELCTPALEQVCDRWSAKGLRRPVLQQFVLTSISMSDDFQSSGQWYVGFESEGDFWVYVEVRLVGDRVEGHTCDT